jgi:hypothetical protein
MSDNSVRFLLTEFQTSIDLWEHIHGRLDGEVKYYFALVGAISALAGLFLQIGASTLAVLGSIHFFAIVIGIAGYLLLRRMAHLTCTMAELAAQVGLIRKCFADLDESITPYIILTEASADRPAHEFPPISKSFSVRIISVANAVIVAIAILLLPVYVYLFLGSAYSTMTWIVIFAVTGVISVINAALFFRYQKKTVIAKCDENLDRLTAMVQQRVQAHNHKPTMSSNI